MVDTTFESTLRLILGSFLPLFFLLAALWFVSWRRSLPKERNPIHDRIARAASLLGALVIGMQIVRSERLRGELGVDAAPTSITRVVAADDSRPFDRLQVLAVIRFDETSVLPQNILERVVPIAATGSTTATFTELSMGVDIGGLQEGDPSRLSQAVRCETGLHYSFQLRNGFQDASFDLGDARRFYTDGLTYELAAPLRLRDRPRGCVSFFWRGLRQDDQIESVRAEGAEQAFLSRFERYQLNRMNFEPLWSARSSIGRITHESNGTAVMLFLLGSLVLFAPLRLRLAVPLAILATVSVLSLDARRDRDLLLERLESPDAAIRATAAAMLGQSSAYAVTACSALRDRFERETDPAVRAEIVRAVADPRRHVGALAEARELFQRARKDESPEVKQAIDSVGGLRR